MGAALPSVSPPFDQELLPRISMQRYAPALSAASFQAPRGRQADQRRFRRIPSSGKKAGFPRTGDQAAPDDDLRRG